MMLVLTVLRPQIHSQMRSFLFLSAREGKEANDETDGKAAVTSALENQKRKNEDEESKKREEEPAAGARAGTGVDRRGLGVFDQGGKECRQHVGRAGDDKERQRRCRRNETQQHSAETASKSSPSSSFSSSSSSSSSSLTCENAKMEHECKKN